MVDNVMEFLKRPIVQLDGFKLTVAMVVIAAVIIIVWKSKRR